MTTKKKKTKRTARKATAKRPKKATKKIAGVKTLVSLVLDESGSMSAVLASTVSSVNEYVGSLKSKGGDMLYTLTKFNSIRTEIIENGTPVAQAKDLTLETYRPDGGTPLFDAVGRTITAIRQQIAGKEKEYGVVVALVTDGAENSSREFTREQIFNLIKDCEKQGWTFVYLGANHDAWAAGTSLGISAANVVKYEANNVAGAMTGLGTATLRRSEAYAARGVVASTDAFFLKADKDVIEGDKK